MSLVLTRVDDRLIHGQVVVGWGRALAPDRIVLVDDDIANEEWEHELYRSGVPSRIAVDFRTVADAAREIPEWAASGERVVILVPDVDSVVRLGEAAPDVREINLGGFHRAEGRTLRLPYLYLSDAEIDALASLASRGVTITAQDLPTAAPVALERLRR